ncbi:hypothetical protein KBB17_01050 [Candidatus Saccharibacteria bacterium]|nr:hypothetical protein [Candidatus Saccharibacteria bacterium]
MLFADTFSDLSPFWVVCTEVLLLVLLFPDYIKHVVRSWKIGDRFASALHVILPFVIIAGFYWFWVETAYKNDYWLLAWILGFFVVLAVIGHVFKLLSKLLTSDQSS